MDFKDIQSQTQNLLSLGYNKDEIMKMVQTAPALFRYTSDGIKEILNSISEDLNIPPLKRVDDQFLADGLNLSELDLPNMNINDSDTHHKTR